MKRVAKGRFYSVQALRTMYYRFYDRVCLIRLDTASDIDVILSYREPWSG